MRDNKVRWLVVHGLAITLVAFATVLTRIPYFMGYINFGDSIIFVLALLGGPFTAALAGGIGSALADLVLAYTVWAFPTLIVKGIEGLIAGLIVHRLASYQNLKSRTGIARIALGLSVAGLWMVLGYFITAYYLYGEFATFPVVAGDLVQAGVSVPVAIILARLLYRANIHRYFQ